MLIPVLSAQYIGQVIKSFASVFQSVNGQSELTAEQVAVFQFYWILPTPRRYCYRLFTVEIRNSYVCQMGIRISFEHFPIENVKVLKIMQNYICCCRWCFLFVLSLAESPRSLTHLCRLRIRHCFTSKQLLTDDAILSLPLPTTVLDYLLYNQSSWYTPVLISVCSVVMILELMTLNGAEEACKSWATLHKVAPNRTRSLQRNHIPVGAEPWFLMMMMMMIL